MIYNAYVGNVQRKSNREIKISDEKDEVDHLIFVVHGIGSVGDLKFRSFVDCGNCTFFRLFLIEGNLFLLRYRVALFYFHDNDFVMNYKTNKMLYLI
jgi:hypothetical protein